VAAGACGHGSEEELVGLHAAVAGLIDSVVGSDVHSGSAGADAVKAGTPVFLSGIVGDALVSDHLLDPLHSGNGFGGVQVGGVGAVIVGDDQVGAEVPGDVGPVPAAACVGSLHAEASNAGLLTDDLGVLVNFFPSGGVLDGAVIVHEAGLLKQGDVDHQAQGVSITGNAVDAAVLVGQQVTDSGAHGVQPALLFQNVGDVLDQTIADQLFRLGVPGLEHSGSIAGGSQSNVSIGGVLVVSGDGFYIGMQSVERGNIGVLVNSDGFGLRVLRPDAQSDGSGLGGGSSGGVGCCGFSVGSSGSLGLFRGLVAAAGEQAENHDQCQNQADELDLLHVSSYFLQISFTLNRT